MPLYPWCSIVSDLLGITSAFSGHVSSDSPAIVEKWKQRTKESMRDYLPLLQDLLEAPLMEENDYTARLSAEERVTSLCRLIEHLLKVQEKTSPCVVVLEDAHLVDAQSLELLSRIAVDCSSILVVVSTCNTSLLPNALRQGQCCVRHELEPLVEQEVFILIQKLLDTQVVPQEVQFLFRTARGNPLFLELIAKDLKESGAINVAEGVCSITGNLSEIELKSVAHMVKTKLDRLPPNQQMVLKVGEFFEVFQKDLKS